MHLSQSWIDITHFNCSSLRTGLLCAVYKCSHDSCWSETHLNTLFVNIRHVLPPLPWSSKFCLIFPRSSCLREPYFFHQTLRLLFFSLLSFVRLLFECGIYSSERCRHQWQLDKVHMSDIVTTVRHCQCVQPMSDLEMSCTTRTALAQWLSSEIFAYVCMCPLYQLQLLFKYHTYFAQSFWLCDFYLRAVLEKYGIPSTYPFFPCNMETCFLHSFVFFETTLATL